jgi:hypothetical protein
MVYLSLLVALNGIALLTMMWWVSEKFKSRDKKQEGSLQALSRHLGGIEDRVEDTSRRVHVLTADYRDSHARLRSFMAPLEAMRADMVEAEYRRQFYRPFGPIFDLEATVGKIEFKTGPSFPSPPPPPTRERDAFDVINDDGIGVATDDGHGPPRQAK